MKNRDLIKILETCKPDADVKIRISALGKETNIDFNRISETFGRGIIILNPDMPLELK